MPIKTYYVCATCATPHELEPSVRLDDLVSHCQRPRCHAEVCERCKLTCSICGDTICMRCIETACVVQDNDPVRCRQCAMQGAA
jgi:hypothetical protein